MRTQLKMLLVLGVAVLLAVPALAQPPRSGGGRGEMGGGAAMLLLSKGVQDELKLTADQIEKARDAVAKIQEKHKDDFGKLRDLAAEERRTKSQELIKSVSDEILKALGDVLKPEQTKRLNQIALQQLGVDALLDEKTLKLTEDQQKKIKTLRDDADKERRDLFQNTPRGGGDFRETMQKVADLRKTTLGKAVDVLDPTQKKAWKDLTGDPFEVKFDAPPGGGRRPPGGGDKPKEKEGEPKKPTT